jgi:hypothetical protein
MATVDQVNTLIDTLGTTINKIRQKNSSNKENLTKINQLAEKLVQAFDRLMNIKTANMNPNIAAAMEAERQQYIQKLTDIMNALDKDTDFDDIEKEIKNITENIRTFTKTINKNLPFENYIQTVIEEIQEITPLIETAYTQYNGYNVANPGENPPIENLLNLLNKSKEIVDELSNAKDPKNPLITFQTVTLEKINNNDLTVKTTIEDLLGKLKTIQQDQAIQQIIQSAGFDLDDSITSFNTLIASITPQPPTISGGRYPRKRRVKKTHRKPRKGGFTYSKSKSKSKKSTKSTKSKSRRSSSSKTRK